MSNLPPNPYNSIPGPPQMNAYGGPQMNHNQPSLGQPNYGGLKADANSNSPIHAPVSPRQDNTQYGKHQSVNNYSQSSNSSPAFNRPGAAPISSALPPSMLPPMKTNHPVPHSASHFPNTIIPPNVPLSTSSPKPVSNVNTSSPYPPSFIPPGRQINDNAPPLIPSSHSFHQPVINGPPVPPTVPGPPSSTPSHYPPSSRAFSPPGVVPPANLGPPGQVNTMYGPPQPAMKQGNTPFTGPSTAVQRSSPIVSGPPPNVQRPGSVGPPVSSTARPIGVNGASFTSIPQAPQPNMGLMGPKTSIPSVGPSPGLGLPLNGPPGPSMQPGASPSRPLVPPNPQVSGPPTGPQSLPPMGPPLGLSRGPIQSSQPGLPSGPAMVSPSYASVAPSVPPIGPPSMNSAMPPGPQGLQGPPGLQSGPVGLQSGPTGLQSGPTMGSQSLPPMGNQMPAPGAPLTNQPVSNMQPRYPPMQQSNYNQNQPQPPRPYPQQYNAHGVTQQMGNLSVTKQGFDQLWGHQNVDLLQTRHILPEYPEDLPEIRLGQQFADAPNCSPDVFRCTVNRIPETNSLLQKSRLPLGILIHPFKDLNHLPVIQCASIVRCRACRTYINPFVYFLDSKRWKCNLCFRVNDLPEEFQYDPVTKSYGDPSRRPEIKSATIEFIAPAEYMLRPPQPAVYLFLMDVSQLAREAGYLEIFCKTLKSCLEQLPGDARTQVGFICYDAHIHYYMMSDDSTRPKEMTVLDIDDVFIPSPESLLVNLHERRELVSELLNVLPRRHAAPAAPACALGAALQAAYKLMAPTGGRITVFQTCLPNVGPGALQPREDPNARSSKEVAHLNPATDFYKRLALDCSGAQIAVDLFLLNSQYSDLATLSGMSKFSAGTVYHIPLFNAARAWQADQLKRTLNRYLTRKIGFEAVMRVRCTRGITIHTFHGNFFVRSTDLLSLPNVSPDAGFGMQLAIEESLSDLQQVCFQAALLYTSSKGERRIRVHTLALPIASTLPDVLHAADQQCIIGLLSKMAVDRCASASMSEAKEALMNVAIDVLSAHRLAQNLPAGAAGPALHAPASLRLLPLYLLALLKRVAFRTGTSTRLDDRVADMCSMKTSPLSQLLRRVYPDLYPVHDLSDEDEPPRLQLSAERINSTGAYLLDDGDTLILYICHGASPAFLSDTFGVTSFNQLPDESRTLPVLDSPGNQVLHAFIERLNDERPYPSNMLILRDNSPSRMLFTERLVDDRVESAFSYYEFLQHIKSQVK